MDAGINSNRRPDEEGIKTWKNLLSERIIDIPTADLMKKGLRPRHQSRKGRGVEFQPQT